MGSPSELASALTDGLVALVAVGLAWRVPAPRARRRGRIAAGFRTFFAATAAAAGCGAILHGAFADRRHPIRRALWRGSLASIGVAAFAGWRTGAALAVPARTARRIERLALVAHGGYAAWVLTRDARFLSSIVAYAPAAAFLAWAFASRLGRPADRAGAALGLVGLGTTGAAASIQVLQLRLHRRLDANATYHSVQAVGLVVLAAAADRLAGQPPSRR